MSAVYRELYDSQETAPCPFTASEIEELESTGEMLVYLPRKLKVSEMCARWGIPTNFDPVRERMIRNVMVPWPADRPLPGRPEPICQVQK